MWIWTTTEGKLKTEPREECHLGWKGEMRESERRGRTQPVFAFAVRCDQLALRGHALPFPKSLFFTAFLLWLWHSPLLTEWHMGSVFKIDFLNLFFRLLILDPVNPTAHVCSTCSAQEEMKLCRWWDAAGEASFQRSESGGRGFSQTTGKWDKEVLSLHSREENKKDAKHMPKKTAPDGRQYEGNSSSENSLF